MQRRRHPLHRIGLVPFAAEHANLLRSLFEHRMENDRPFPEDILLMVMDAFALMHQPLVRLLPDREPEQVALLSRRNGKRRCSQAI